jgi:hypothetical protein
MKGGGAVDAWVSMTILGAAGHRVVHGTAGLGLIWCSSAATEECSSAATEECSSAATEECSSAATEECSSATTEECVPRARLDLLHGKHRDHHFPEIDCKAAKQRSSVRCFFYFRANINEGRK